MTTDPIKGAAPRTDNLPMLARARLFAFVGFLPLSCLNVPPPDAGDTGIGPGDEGGDGTGGDGADDGVDDGADDGADDGGEKLDLGATTLDGTSESGSESSSGSGSDDTAGTSSGSTDDGSSGTSGDGSSSTTG